MCWLTSAFLFLRGALFPRKVKEPHGERFIVLSPSGVQRANSISPKKSKAVNFCRCQCGLAFPSAALPLSSAVRLCLTGRAFLIWRLRLRAQR